MYLFGITLSEFSKFYNHNLADMNNSEGLKWKVKAYENNFEISTIFLAQCIKYFIGIFYTLNLTFSLFTKFAALNSLLLAFGNNVNLY